jgi:EAL domain-containing protein (putative c-di-GMP-specific phosphodiesterase class I)
METNPYIDKQLINFRDHGIEVAIDDFGTGYSSLSYLHKFDIDYLKIDQSFITGLPTDENSIAICEAIIEMAHKLKLMVIAEGVETEAQYLKLKEMGCDYGQGYWFAEPMTAEDMTIMLDCAKRHAEAEQCQVDEQQHQD